MKILALVVQFISQSPRRLWPMGTWANRPNPATFPFAFYFVTDVAGGALFRSTGARWVPVSGSIVLANQNTLVSVGATTAESVLHSVAIPAGLLGMNDRIEIEFVTTCTGSTNQKDWRVRVGGTGIDGTVMGTMSVTAAASTVSTGRGGFTNRNSVSSQVTLARSLSIGGNSGAVNTAAVDFSVDQTVYFTGQKASAGETNSLETIVWKQIRGV